MDEATLDTNPDPMDFNPRMLMSRRTSSPRIDPARFPLQSGGVLPPPPDADQFARRFAIAVSAHPAYAHLLPALLEEWDMQTRGLNVVKLLLYDHPDPPAVSKWWRVVAPKDKPYGQPSPLRNEVLEMDVDWVQYWDADNFPAPDHFGKVFAHAQGAADNVGLIFPRIIGAYGKELEVPPGRDPRRGYFLDTACCWRREAILSAGGWQSGLTVEDWALARDMRLAGWEFEQSSVVFNWSNTPGNRTSGNSDAQAKWDARDFAIIILFRGDDHFFQCVREDLGKLDLPRHCSVTVVADGDKDFYRKVNKWISALGLGGRFERLTLSQARPQTNPIKAKEEFIKIHAHVADLYARAIRATPEELILFIEDDVRFEPGALRALSDEMATKPGIACCGAPYLIRENTYMAAARAKDYWDEPIRMSELTQESITVGMLAGGFTLYQRHAFEECPMLGPFKVRGRTGPLGWDGTVCKRFNEAGYTIRLVGKSKVEHLPR